MSLAGGSAAALTTGWEPDAPTDDTVVRQYLLHWAAYCEAHATAGRGSAVRTPAFAAADLRRPSGYFDSATLLQPPGDDFDVVLDEIEEFFAAGTGQALLWSAWPTPDLAARGWRCEGHPPVLVRPPGSQLPVPSHPPVDLREVRRAEALVEWERVAVEGYPFPELMGLSPGALADAALLDDERIRFWVGYQDHRPVSIGTLFVDCGIASFALAVTKPEARRRGHWSAHAAARIAAAPNQWMTGVFSDDSAPGARRIGFLPVWRLTLWSLARP